jgi:hypothetical protein
MSTRRHTEVPYFGACPDCETPGSYYYANVGRCHWFYCEEHKTQWLAGSNLFSSWQHQTEEVQRAEYDRIGLGEFRHVKPKYDFDEERCAKCDREAFEAIWQSLQLAMTTHPSLAADKDIENAYMVAYTALEELCDHLAQPTILADYDTDELPF